MAKGPNILNSLISISRITPLLPVTLNSDLLDMYQGDLHSMYCTLITPKYKDVSQPYNCIAYYGR